MCRGLKLQASVSRTSALAGFEELHGILFYPVQYEARACSRNVIYTGAAPNRQAIAVVDEGRKECSVECWQARIASIRTRPVRPGKPH